MRFVLTTLALLAPTVATSGPLEFYFNDPEGFTAPLDQCTTAHCKAALNLIESAEESLDIAIYGLRNQSKIYRAILAARDRGVRVRVVVDKDIKNHNYYTSTPKLEAELGDAVRDDYKSDKRTAAKRKPYDPRTARCESPAGFLGPAQCLGYDLGDKCLVGVHASREALEFQGDIMHHKFIIADQLSVWTGSTNLSDSGTGGYNANIVTVLNHPKIAGWYTKEFEQMWVHDRYHNEKVADGERKRLKLGDDLTIEVFFSPQDEPMVRAVRPHLQKAKKSIDVAVFFLTDKNITADLIAAHQRGVKVRILMDATAATNGYTKHEVLRSAGIPVKIETWGGKMHAKSAVVDGKIIISGSMNWTSAGHRGNDENTVVIFSRSYGQAYLETFNKLWNDIDDKWLRGRPDAESMDSPVACADGVDNDYDKKIDADDPGCGPNPPPLPPLPPHRIVPKEDGHDLIKGVVLDDGRKLFYTPQSRSYAQVQVEGSTGAQWFCAESQAWDSGFRRARD
ncbi:MAG: DUF1669 domain-containing protein [Deltaproteobacteria bacterium]|nr:MAG: DUF1669 domain-containing protein [Deltaproteobacteria bacterium]